jgi:Dyp-type peroxidase family
MTQIELSEIQAYLLNDYKEMASSRYYLLKVKDAAAAKTFISSIAGNITNAGTAAQNTSMNIGFTNTGLLALGLNEVNMHSFSREFREGMVTEHRKRLLGDFDSSDPSKWEWGGPTNERVDVMLLLFAINEAALDNLFEQLRQNLETGFSIVHILDNKALPNDREHFGFRDGISQPVIKGSGMKPAGNNNDINAGEFVMGYENEYEIFPASPLLLDDKNQGNKELLPADVSGSSFKDLGKNGTYFVLRQLRQDVDGFWNFLKQQSDAQDAKTKNEESTLLAAKMMGRWPSGASLVKHDTKDPGGDSDENDFSYYKSDPEGDKCPFGAHIRRMNPRDQFEESPPSVSLKLTRRHRIIRRVRSYGEDFIASAENHKPNGEVGLLFGCFNANISKQFEFIQYTWANSPKFKRLYADPDPFIGVRENPPLGMEQNFTIPQNTTSRIVSNLQSFVFVKGGAYFFFPSISAVKFIGSL